MFPIRRVGTAAVAATAVLLGGLTLPVHASPAGTHTVTPAVTRHPRYVYAGQAIDGTTFGCQKPAAAVHCYGPAQIRAAYEIQPVLDQGITGKGRTIVIVDAFQAPHIATDLHTFDGLFGLPDTTLNIIAPDGLTPYDAADSNQVGWSGEISLDVEWAHAVAPDATIDLVLAKSNQDADILSATRYAVDNELGDVISQSFGEAESCVDPQILKAEHHVFQLATAKHITLLASSGDQGAAQPSCDGTSYIKSASSPASDTLVTGVGGTQLRADLTTGAYGSETTWNEPAFGAATGGGFSTIYKSPSYQNHVPAIGKARGVPDVAYNAAIDGGVLTVWSPDGTAVSTGVYLFGGTSAGSPQWAGITALADQAAGGRLGRLNPAIYRIGQSPAYAQAFHDVTTGDNSFTGADANGNPVTVSGYGATTGWDATTGWGTPRVAELIPQLLTVTHPKTDNDPND